MTPLEQKIESLLFFKSEPVSFSWLGKTLGEEPTIIADLVDRMQSHYVDRGMSLVLGAQEVALMTSDSSKGLIQSLSKQESAKELSKQALETLAIVCYNSGITKSEIDYIRGVNSVFILRNLTIRGLVSKEPNPDDKRSPLYVTTIDMLNHLGISNRQELPKFTDMQMELSKLTSNMQRESLESSENSS